jgi:hypothetical protein
MKVVKIIPKAKANPRPITTPYPTALLRGGPADEGMMKALLRSSEHDYVEEEINVPSN